jgi:hypothetical protein
VSDPAPTRYDSPSIEAGIRHVYTPGGHIFVIAWVLLGVANFSEPRNGEVRRIPLRRTWVNKGIKKGQSC